MYSIKSYILSVVGAAIIGAVVKGLINEKNATGQIIKLLCGILMTITVIAPIAKISFDNITEYFSTITDSGNLYVDNGKTLARDSMSAIIKNQTEAYILDKADRMGLDIVVEVELDADNNTFPCGITIHGSVSPYAKEEMGSYIEENLGIAKEYQKWTSKH